MIRSSQHQKSLPALKNSILNASKKYSPRQSLKCYKINNGKYKQNISPRSSYQPKSFAYSTVQEKSEITSNGKRYYFRTLDGKDKRPFKMESGLIR